MTFAEAAGQWLSQSTGIVPRDLDIVPLKGATSSSVFLVQCSRVSNPPRFVLRILDNQQWLAEEPDLAAHEAAALQEVQKTRLQAPQLMAYSAHDVGFGAPVVLMSFLEGRSELHPPDFGRWIDKLASQLAVLHRHRAPQFPWRYRSWLNRTALAAPGWTVLPHVWERAIEVVLAAAPDSDTVFIHRDYHATNVLWDGAEVSGVVDWINACQGPAGVDVAHCRTNLALLFGPWAAEQFLEAYAKAADEFEHHPYWDLDSILDMCLPEPRFYDPWQEFGVPVIDPAVLRQRVEAHLQQVILRL